MELALTDSNAHAAGATADVLRRNGFARVGAQIGAAVAADSTFAFSCDALGPAGLHPVAEYRPPANIPTDTGRYPLRLLTLKRHYSINSSYGNLPVMLNAEPDAKAEIHPLDAAARNLADGDSICIYNDFGRMQCKASLSDKVGPGTVAVPFGRWRSDPGTAGANSLTSDSLGDLANGPTFCDNLVEVEAI
jgi:anaerobic selenocysteine-containing dehydrogenase